MSQRLSRAVVVFATCVVAASVARAQTPPSPADRIEAIEPRAWAKTGAFELAPHAAYGLNDPFLLRGGGGLRAIWWPRALLGVTVDASGWAQAPSASARLAQRELKARLRDTGAGWALLGGLELATVDGKIALGSRLVPFELVGRAELGAEASSEDVRSAPVLALGAGVGARFFFGRTWGLEASFDWRSASLERDLGGQLVPGRDTVVSFDVGVPMRFGGGR